MTLLPLRRLGPALAALSWLAACSGDGPSGPAAPVPVATVQVTAPTGDVWADQTLQLTAVVRDGAGQPLAQRAVTWRSEDTTMARVDATGLVTGMTVGAVTIVAASEGKEGRLPVRVRSRVSRVFISTYEYSPFGSPFMPTLAVGRTTQIHVTALDSAGAAVPITATRWSTSDPAIATVAPTDARFAVLAALAPGRVTVTATVEGVRQEFPMVIGKGYVLTERKVSFAEVTNLNEQGHVVGSINRRAFLWRDGELIDLGLRESVAWDINDLGQVVGAFNTRPDGSSDPIHPFLWQEGQVTDLAPGAAEHTHATAINGRGDVAGYTGPRRTDIDAPARVVLWRNGTMNDLGTLGGYGAFALDIDAEGRLVGFVRPVGGPSNHPFLLRGDGQRTDIAVQDPRTQAVAIGDDGTVVGNSGNGSAFVWRGGTLAYLPSAGEFGSAMRASDVNRHGQVVGYALRLNSTLGILWVDGVAMDLTGLVTVPNIPIRRAVAINDRGQIAVETLYGIGLLTPVP